MNKKDRRYQRTRQFIMEAFTNLLERKPFDKININEIADLANINRSTFYLHFVDKYALLDEYIDELLKDLYEQSEQFLQTPEFTEIEHCLEIILTCLYEKREIFKILFKTENNPYFQPRFKTIIERIITQGTKTQSDSNTLENEFTIQIKTAALAGIIEWWLSSSAPIPVDTMVKNILKVLVKLEDLDIHTKSDDL